MNIERKERKKTDGWEFLRDIMILFITIIFHHQHPSLIFFFRNLANNNHRKPLITIRSITQPKSMWKKIKIKQSPDPLDRFEPPPHKYFTILYKNPDLSSTVVPPATAVAHDEREIVDSDGGKRALWAVFLAIAWGVFDKLNWNYWIHYVFYRTPTKASDFSSLGVRKEYLCRYKLAYALDSLFGWIMCSVIIHKSFVLYQIMWSVQESYWHTFLYIDRMVLTVALIVVPQLSTR